MSATSENTRPAAKGKRAHLPLEIEWEDEAPLTVHGHLTFLSKYLEAGGLFKRLVENCPMKFTSNNAPEVADVLGTALLSILSGHTRYNHAQELYGDTLAAELLGIGRLVSHDSLRRAFGKMEGKDAKEWLQGEMSRCVGPLLSEPYVLDIDPTVKTLYGEQEGAEVGYNPKKPGRPSHCLHAFFIGSLRLVAGVELRPGNETAGCYSHETLWRLLDGPLGGFHRPWLVRGDIGFGNNLTMEGCELRKLCYLNSPSFINPAGFEAD